MVIYLDDILIYSTGEEEHWTQLREVLQRPRINHLYAQVNKCEFFKTSIEFLGHMVDAKGVIVDQSKVQVVQDWPGPRSMKEVQSFLGLAFYYRRFVKGFSEVAAPLTWPLQKTVAFTWDSQQQSAF